MTKRAAALSCFLVAGFLIWSAPALAQSCVVNPPSPDLICNGDIVLGDGAMLMNTTGTYNIAFGNRTLGNNLTGNFNVAVGAYALYESNADGNTAVGHDSLLNNSTGAYNAATGYETLYTNTTGAYNTASGYEALFANTTGAYNTAAGYEALFANRTGGYNVALGMDSLHSMQTGSDNTAVGPAALMSSLSGYNNVAVGLLAGAAYTGGESYNVALASYGVAGDSGVIRIGSVGNQSKAFIVGIYGTTSSSGIPVSVNSAGQLGTVTSSLRFKEDVAGLGAAGDVLMKLRPVTFHYKPQYDDGQRVLQYGLIAEEVAAIDPGLVQYGDDGEPLTVRYHFVDTLLLGEVQKQHATIAGQASEIAKLESTIAGLAERLAKLEAAGAGARR